MGPYRRTVNGCRHLPEAIASVIKMLASGVAFQVGGIHDDAFQYVRCIGIFLKLIFKTRASLAQRLAHRVKTQWCG